MEGIWKRAFGKGLLEEGKFLEGNWHAPFKTEKFCSAFLVKYKIAEHFLDLKPVSETEFLTTYARIQQTKQSKKSAKIGKDTGLPCTGGPHYTLVEQHLHRLVA